MATVIGVLGIHLGARVALATKTGEPVSTATANIRGNGNSFDVGHGGGAPENADVGGKWRLEARLPLFALQALNKCL